MPTNFCDVCLFCSVPDELTALKEVFIRLGSMELKSGYTEERREMFVGSIQNVHGESLVVQMSCLPEMGGTNATAHIVLALREFRPRFAAMTGICAGDREKVTLGDIVIATRAYEYEAGKVIIEDGKPILLNDVKTFSPNDNIIGYANVFEEWREDVHKLRRPPSRRQQQEWLLSELSSTEKRLEDLQLQSLIENMPDWRTITTEMERGDNPLLTGNGSLTEFARRRRRSSPPYKDRSAAEKFLMVMGSGRAVRSDNPFPSLRGPERKLIAVDMEGASVYHAVDTFDAMGRRALVVKGVSDYGDAEKDDSYRRYASEASAIYLFRFIMKYVTQQLMPRLAPEGHIPAREVSEPGWINVMVFILTACPLLSVLLVTVTLASWLFLSDFFLAREGWIWASWANHVAFLGVGSLVFSLIATTTRNVICRNARVHGPALDLNLEDRPISSWCDILQRVADDSQGIARYYFAWLRNRLSRLDPRRQVSHDRIGKAWRETSTAGLRNLIGATWAIVLLLFLIIPQLHSPLMEQLSRLFSNQPSSPLVVFTRYYDKQLGVRDEVLEVDRRFGFWRPKTALIGGRSELFIMNADFPRTNRQICITEFIASGGSSQHCLLVRRGMTKYEFARTDRQPLLDLEVALEQYVGKEFYRISLEHIRR